MPEAPVIEQPPQTTTSKPEVVPPKPWAVIIHNDESTPFEDVLLVLCTVFNHNAERAEAIMMHAHFNGEAEVQRYQGQDMAETKCHQANDKARSLMHPFTGQSIELTFSARAL